MERERRPGIRPLLGVSIDPLAQVDGLLVDAVMPKSIAQKMGIVPGDVLLDFNKTHLTSKEQLHEMLGTLQHTDRLTLRWRHGSQIVTRHDNPHDVPVLASYVIREGLGVRGVVQLGWTREQVEATLGPPLQAVSANGLLLLVYPFDGITVGMIRITGNDPRVISIAFQYPFVGRTLEGLSTVADRIEIPGVYHSDHIVSERPSEGIVEDSIPALGIRFESINGRIRRVEVLLFSPVKQSKPPAAH